MNIEISEIDSVMVEDDEGVEGTRARSLGKLSTSPTLVWLPRPEARQGAVVEQGYQMVTRAKGKPKQTAKAAATKIKRVIYQTEPECRLVEEVQG